MFYSLLQKCPSRIALHHQGVKYILPRGTTLVVCKSAQTCLVVKISKDISIHRFSVFSMWPDSVALILGIFIKLNRETINVDPFSLYFIFNHYNFYTVSIYY